MKNNNINFYQNNFDLIRLFAALQVMFLHSIGYLKLHNVSELIIKFFQQFPGVPIFFIISGFLISASIERSKNFQQYFKNRFLRIYPALWIAIIVALCTMLIFYDKNIPFSHIIKWLIARATILQFYHDCIFDNYGMGNLDGTLWTLSIELQFYILLAFIYYFFKNNIDMVMLLLFIISIYFTTVYNIKNYDSLYSKLLGTSLLPYLFIFLLGCFFQRNFESIKQYINDKFLFWIVVYLLLNYYFSNNSFYKIVIINIILSFVVISFAYSYRNISKIFLKDNDISYGIYIYHLIIINIFISLGWTGNIWYFALLVILTVVVSYVSWIFIEKPALRLKNYSLYYRK